MKTETPLASLRERVGLDKARKHVSESEYAAALLPVIDAVLGEPEKLWRVYDAVQMANVVSAFNLDRILRKSAGFDFAELVDRARIDHALRSLSESGDSIDEIAELYWPPRTRAQQLKELHANVAIVDNKLSSRENLSEAFTRMLDQNLDSVIASLRP